MVHTNLMCMEKEDYIRLVNTSRQYADKRMSNYRVFNKKDKTTEYYKEKQINGVNCVIFGWKGKSINALDVDNDLYGISIQKDKAKNGYILMEFENNMLVKFKDESKIKELGEAIKINKILRDDFSLVYNDEIEKEEEEEFE